MSRFAELWRVAPTRVVGWCRHSVWMVLMGSCGVDDAQPMLRLRGRDGSERAVTLAAARLADVVDAAPWRQFRWYRGQRHFSGSYWSATMQAPVGYESRLELANLLLLDWDPGVRLVRSQPFLVQCGAGSEVRRHVPDFLVVRGAGGLEVVDVKPAALVREPRVAAQLGWSRDVFGAQGWGYRVVSEPDPVLVENVRFLAGYRRSVQFPDEVVMAVVAALPAACTFVEAVNTVASVAGGVGSARAVLLHALWCGRLQVDLLSPLAGGSVLVRR